MTQTFLAAVNIELRFESGKCTAVHYLCNWKMKTIYFLTQSCLPCRVKTGVTAISATWLMTVAEIVAQAEDLAIQSQKTAELVADDGSALEGLQTPREDWTPSCGTFSSDA